jgi:multidrug efflux pump
MFSKFFIDRPIFASVLSIMVTLAGGIAILTLPIAQYPEITPPTVEISAYYPGANAQVVADTVAAPIEQQVNGVENMLYMSSQCTNDGKYTLTITFRHGVDLNMAQVLVQNREALAEPLLPDLVKRRGVTVKKKSPSILMIVNLFSPDASRDNLYLSNYATIQIKDELARLPGVGDITYLGQRDYSMRVWLDPDKMSARDLTASDVVAAIQQQNAQVAAGQIGQPPVPKGQAFQYTMSTLGRLTTAQQFGDMILKSDQEGRVIRMRDVSHIELGAQAYDQTCTLDGRPSVALSVYQRPGSNAFETSERVKEKMEELKARFPKGVDYAIVYDTTPFILESVREVFNTLRDAVILVAIVVLLFLQNWRSALIPLVAVPVAIIGTFAVMAILGFSLNNLTLFGLVLAIGIVVDDAIVVVEAVEHHLEQGLSPRQATIVAMEQVSGPVVAIGLVLSAVFIPCAFITGIIGQFFRQFALTIATSTLISAFNSLTLSPALAALLLKPKGEDHKQGHVAEPLPKLAFVLLGSWLAYTAFPGLQALPTSWAALVTPVRAWPSEVVLTLVIGLGALAGWLVSGVLNRVLAVFFAAFNAGFRRATEGYVALVGRLLRVSTLALVAYCGLIYLTYHGLTTTPTGFIPSQDKGYLLVNVQLPDSTAVERTEAIMARVEQITRQQPGVKHTVAIAGQSLLLGANAPNFGSMYVMLDDHHKRTAPGLHADAIAAKLENTLRSQIEDGLIGVFGAPPVDGLGTVGGFKVVIEDRGDLGRQAIQDTADKIVGQKPLTADDDATTPKDDSAVASTSDERDRTLVTGLFTSFRANTPWLNLDIDREMVKTMGVSMSEVFNTLQVYLGSLYINDFNLFGRTWQVNVQADAKFRRRLEDLKLLKFRNDRGEMVPLGAITNFRETTGPVMVVRYNLYPSATINGAPAPGVSSGQAIDAMQRIVDRALPASMRSEWTELALLQLQTGNTAMYAFTLAVVLVFLVLAAQYESWALPLAVILVVPMCLLSSVTAVVASHMDINIFTQIGFIVLVGLACKNAILIVEFARARHEAGAPRYEATLEACRLRLRPIVMTSLAFILGVVPLVVSVGAGAEMRRTLGTAVFGGMLGVTLFGIFLTPVFYFVIQWASDLLAARRAAAEEDSADDELLSTPDGNGHYGGSNGHLTPSHGHAPTHAAGAPTH